MARVLVIDDESNIRGMLRLALTHVGHSVEVAADGYEGLEKFGDGSNWDVTLLDQRMPGMEGLEVLRAIREHVPSAHVVMITAFGTIDLAAEAMSAGATDFLRKPFTVETLRGAVDTALAGRLNTAASDSPIPFAFDRMTVNGFRLRSSPGVTKGASGDIDDSFTITTLTGHEHTCRVVIPSYVVELVKTYADRDDLPGGERFWQALCGEALANYLWQNADLPEGDAVTMDGLTSGLKHWIDAVLTASDNGIAGTP